MPPRWPVSLWRIAFVATAVLFRPRLPASLLHRSTVLRLPVVVDDELSFSGARQVLPKLLSHAAQRRGIVLRFLRLHLIAQRSARRAPWAGGSIQPDPMFPRLGLAVRAHPQTLSSSALRGMLFVWSRSGILHAICSRLLRVLPNFVPVCIYHVVNPQ